MADLEAHRAEVEQWTASHREKPEFEKKLVFDQSVSSSKSSASREVSKQASTHLIGHFGCQCKPKRKKTSKKENRGASVEPEPQTRDWPSGKVFTEIFVVIGEHECKFDAVVWSQQCLNCRTKVSSDVDEEVYKERVFSKLLLLLGLREVIIRDDDEDEEKTQPHVKSLCCACKAGKCLKAGRGY
ncbi:hypothetical protein Gpo141_00009466 [Globisporangium polare]